MPVAILRSRLRRLTDTCLCVLLPGGLEVWRVIWSVQGYLFPHEGVFLCEIGRTATADNPVVEIGSMRGLSTCCIATGVRSSSRSGKVIAIDPHLYGTEAELRHNLHRMGLASFVEVRVAHAEDVARSTLNQLAAVFIDGAHDLQSVTRDFDIWSPKVRPGGFVLIHDSTSLSKFPGPAHIAETRLTVGEHFDAAGHIGSITWARKRGGAGRPPTLRGSTAIDALIRFAKRGRSEPSG